MSYVEEVYAGLEAKHPNEPEFLEAAKRVLDSLEPIEAPSPRQKSLRPARRRSLLRARES